MKKIILFLLLSTTTLFAQKRQASADFITSGPIAPIIDKYMNAKRFSLKFNFTSDLSGFLSKNGENIENYPKYFNKSIAGLQYSLEQPDLQIEYNITKFKYIESRVENKLPAHIFGFEANVQIFDNERNLIYSRYLTPRSNLFLDDAETKMGSTAIWAIIHHFNNLISDFNKYYLWQPTILANSMQLAKLPKNSDLTDVNLSTAIFLNISGMNHAERENAFAPAIEYWKGLLNYNTKDDSDKKDINFISYYNTALGYVLIGKIDEAEKLMPLLKEYNRKSFYEIDYVKNLEKIIKSVKDTQETVKELGSISPIEENPNFDSNQQANNIFEYMEFSGSGMDQKGATYDGIFRIILEDPIKINFRTKEESSPAKLLGVFTSDMRVRITVPNEKKPIKKDLSDFIWIKNGAGQEFNVMKVGNFFETNKRYILARKIGGNAKIGLYEESFPKSSTTFIKRMSDEDPLKISLVTPMTSLKEYFVDCPTMTNFIETKQFKSFDTLNKLNKKLLEMYIASDCGK